MKALSPIAVLISALLLQGCVAAAVVGNGALGFTMTNLLWVPKPQLTHAVSAPR